MSDQPTSRSPELEELLRMANTYFLQDLHTALPGRVEEYFPDEQKADIKPLIKRCVVHEDGSELCEELPIIPDVPIVFPRTGKFFITFPIEKGDLVMMHFIERSIDKYYSSDGADTNPDEFRMHDLSDAVAVPGFYPRKQSIKDIDTANLVMGNDEGGLQIHVTPNGTMEVKVGGASDEAVALANTMKMWWDSVVKVWQMTHTHPTGVGPSGPPMQPPPEFDDAIISTVLLLKGP